MVLLPDGGGPGLRVVDYLLPAGAEVSGHDAWAGPRDELADAKRLGAGVQPGVLGLTEEQSQRLVRLAGGEG